MNLERILCRIDPAAGTIADVPSVERHLSDLRGCFADAQAYESELAAGDPLVYHVASVKPASGDGDLHYGLGLLRPGQIGEEYYMTKGHLHARREAAEIYIGLTGQGLMLLEDEATGQSRLVELNSNGVVYVPGHTAHRTINVGDSNLTYLGIYPAKAGYDYGRIAKNNFRCVVVARHGRPVMVERKAFCNETIRH